MSDISVIILVGNEERHIRRCLERLAPLEPQQIFVVESQNGDRTHDIAEETGRRLKFEVRSSKFDVSSSKADSNSSTSNIKLQTIFNTWPGTQAKQFNWAVDNLPIEANWVLRLDADEYLTPETIERLKTYLSTSNFELQSCDLIDPREGARSTGDGVASNFKLQTSNSPVYGLTLELRRPFCGGEISHATNGIRQVRIFRRGHGRYDEGLMDERLIISSRPYSTLTDGQKDLCEPLRTLCSLCSETANGHGDGDSVAASCALENAKDAENAEECKGGGDQGVEDFEGAFYDDSLMPMTEWKAKHRKYAKREAAQAIESLRTGVWTDPRKAAYYRLSKFLRAFAYFGVRYFLKGGFLDGYAGWQWNFWQGLWYRCLVDLEMARMGK